MLIDMSRMLVICSFAAFIPPHVARTTRIAFREEPMFFITLTRSRFAEFMIKSLSMLGLFKIATSAHKPRLVCADIHEACFGCIAC